MNDRLAQAADYITQRKAQGDTEEQICQSFLKSGWDETTINQAFTLVAASMSDSTQGVSPALHDPVAKKNNVRNGLLWILSPIIILMFSLIANILFRMMGIRSPIVNILSILLGMAGVILVFVGPIVGIVKLTRK